MIKYALIEGVSYPINTSFRVAIECDKIMNSPDVNDYDRGIMVTGLLFGGNSPYCDEALEKARVYLTAGSENEDDDVQRILDFEQHWDYYYGAFRAQYGIDLNTQDLHYHEFVSLLKTIKGQALNDIIELLTYDLSEVKDPKQKSKIIKVQNKLKIKNVKQEAPIESAFLSQLSPKVKGG